MYIEDAWILRALMENTSDGIYVKDRQCKIWRVSRKLADSLGFTELEEVYGKTDIDLYGEEFGNKTMLDDLEVMESGIPKTGVIDKFQKPDGEYNWTSSTKMPLRNDHEEIVGLLGISREINEIKNAEHAFQWLATHDPLTTLPNRYLLLDRIEQAISLANRNSESFAILFLDIDEFKKINDLQGHMQGDEYLIKLSDLLVKNLRCSDTIARFGGDEFVVLLNEMRDRPAARIVADKINKMIFDQVDPINHTFTASIGLSLYPEDGNDAPALLNAADLSMYETKQQRNLSD
jgi:diguanylate cyclase (GGDEF)-like protein/PAS domain S-box-containing protein